MMTSRITASRCRFLVAITLASLALTGASTIAAETLDELVPRALASDIRTDAEKARDDNRKPLETLQFFGLEPDMRVLELVPGGGWYTKVLAPVLRENGKLYVAVGTQNIEDSLLNEPGFDQVEVVSVEADIGREGRRMTTDDMRFDVADVDMVLTFRNLHNFTDAGRAAINKAAFDALRPGGHYGVKDHTRRHMEAESAENWRRMDPVLMIKEIEAAGFEFVDFSDLHHRPSDTLEHEVGHPDVTGNSDRFTLLFRKPE